jgi:8-oxo-dGTP pyrophosphatase MutT (NUDIX family)
MRGMSDARWKPSVTVAAVVEHGGRYLLVEEHTPEGLRLNQPAGHLEEGESLLEAACRECLEETACEMTPQALLGVYLARLHRPAMGGRPAETISHLRFAYIGSVGAPLPGRALDSGIVRTLWLTPDEIRASVERHRSPLVLKCVDDHLAGRRLPLDAVNADLVPFIPGTDSAPPPV